MKFTKDRENLIYLQEYWRLSLFVSSSISFLILSTWNHYTLFRSLVSQKITLQHLLSSSSYIKLYSNRQRIFKYLSNYTCSFSIKSQMLNNTLSPEFPPYRIWSSSVNHFYSPMNLLANIFMRVISILSPKIFENVSFPLNLI